MTNTLCFNGNEIYIFLVIFLVFIWKVLELLRNAYDNFKLWKEKKSKKS